MQTFEPVHSDERESFESAPEHRPAQIPRAFQRTSQELARQAFLDSIQLEELVPDSPSEHREPNPCVKFMILVCLVIFVFVANSSRGMVTNQNHQDGLCYVTPVFIIPGEEKMLQLSYVGPLDVSVLNNRQIPLNIYLYHDIPPTLDATIKENIQTFTPLFSGQNIRIFRQSLHTASILDLKWTIDSNMTLLVLAGNDEFQAWRKKRSISPLYQKLHTSSGTAHVEIPNQDQYYIVAETQESVNSTLEITTHTRSFVQPAVNQNVAGLVETCAADLVDICHFYLPQNSFILVSSASFLNFTDITNTDPDDSVITVSFNVPLIHGSKSSPARTRLKNLYLLLISIGLMNFNTALLVFLCVIVILLGCFRRVVVHSGGNFDRVARPAFLYGDHSQLFQLFGVEQQAPAEEYDLPAYKEVDDENVTLVEDVEVQEVTVPL